MMKKFLVIIVTLFTGLASFGQGVGPLEYSGFFDTYYRRGPLNIIPTVSLPGYYGDLNNGPFDNNLAPAYGLEMNYKVWPRTYFGGAFNYIPLSGSDKSNPNRGITFNSRIYELVATARFNLVDDIVRRGGDRLTKPKFIKPYIHVGIGLMVLNSGSTMSADSNYFNPPREESRPTPILGVAAPVGIGAAFFVSNRFSILLEGNYRIPVTDYLDDTHIRGNTSTKDAFYTVDLKLQISPWAPKLKRKRVKRSGNTPSEGAATGGGGGGGSTAPAKPAETAPADTAPADVAPGTETPPADGQPTETAPAEDEKKPAEEKKEEKEEPLSW